MRKLLRLIVVSVGAVALIGVVLALVAPRLIDPGTYKQRLSALIKERTGHTLRIDGDVKLAVFPWLTLELGPVQLSNAPGFGPLPLLQAQHSLVRIKLLPLLRQQVQIERLSLNGVQLRLARDAGGTSNWLGPSGTATSNAAAPDPTLALQGIGGIELLNASLVWEDRRAGSFYQVSDLNVHTGRFAPGLPFAISIGCKIATGQNAPVYQLQFSSTLNAEPATQRYRLRNTHLELGLPQGGVATLSSDVDLDLAQQSLILPAIEISVHGLKLSGKLTGVHIRDNPDLRGELQVAQFSPRELLKALGKALPEGADAAALATASARFGWRAGRDQITLQPLTLTLDDSTASGELSIRDFAAPRFGVVLEVDAINMDRYLPPPDVVTKAAPWPVTTLQTLNLGGSLHIGRLQAYQVHSTDVRLTFN